MKMIHAVLLSLFLVPTLLLGATGDVGVSIKPGSVKLSQMHASALQSVDLNLTSSQMDTLNATPVSAIAAPGSGYVTQVESVLCKVVSTGLTAFELGSGTVDFRYTDGSGGLAAQLTNAFVESSSDAYFQAYGRDAVAVVNAAIVAYASTDVSQGTGSLNCRVFYRTVRGSDI